MSKIKKLKFWFVRGASGIKGKRLLQKLAKQYRKDGYYARIKQVSAGTIAKHFKLRTKRWNLFLADKYKGK